MAIPSKQIGGSVNYNLLWQISKQLEELICIRSGGCISTTTTTTTTSAITILALQDCTPDFYTAYTTSPAFAVGIMIYQDSGLTIPYDSILLGTTDFQSYKYNIVNGLVTNTPTICD